MPLSSVVGAQSVVKPGVCTSTTRPASPFDGQVIYETDTDKTLVWNGSGWVFLSTSRANPSGLDFIKSQTIGSAVSSVTVSDVFSSTYDNYKIVISGGAATTDVIIGTTLGSTSTGYYCAYTGATYSAAGSSNFNDNNAGSWTRCVSSTGSGAMGVFDLIGPNLAKRTFIIGSQMDPTVSRFASGFLNDTTQYTSITFTVSGGTQTGGTIRIYGYVNS